MVLLPVALSSGMAPAQIESILAHELAHVRRLDPLVEGVARKDGKPMHGARVVLWAGENNAPFAGAVRFGADAATHVDGKFVIRHAPSIPLKVKVFPPAPPQGNREPIDGPAVTPEPGETTKVEVGGAGAPGVG